MKFCGYFHPVAFPQTQGFNKEGGSFWIGFINDEDVSDGLVRIELTVPAENSPRNNCFASIHIHYDGIKVIRRLEEIGFLDLFERIQASTFYDVVQCCSRCDVPIIYHGEYGDELMSRKMYALLHDSEGTDETTE